MKTALAAFLLIAAVSGQIPVDPDTWPGDSFDKYHSFVSKLDQFNRKLGRVSIPGTRHVGLQRRLGYL